MFETIAIPALLKAVDFIFDEAGKILEERRERRKTNAHQEAQSIDQLNSSIDSEDTIYSKNLALQHSISESIWNDTQSDLQHLMKMLEIHKKNYYLAKEQYAKWGSALVPPIIVSNLSEAEDDIAGTTKKLLEVLSRVYGKEVIIPEIR
ncbi:hypothetical protein KFU94_00315 [Chloroflexi bacterium TSY]|nr:hypothetical protein [Chloroflexi bacterium TSY]